MGRGDKLFVCVELYPRQELAFERVEHLIGPVVVEAQDTSVGSVCREEIPVLVQQRFALLMVSEHCSDALGNIGKQAVFYAVEARKKAVFLPVYQVAVEVNYLLCQQLALSRGAALQLPTASVLTCVQKLGYALGCGFPRNYLCVVLIARRITLRYAYPIRAHPCRVALAVHADAHTAVVDRGQKCGNFI